MPVEYTTRQNYIIFFAYAQCNGNAKATVRKLARERAELPTPSEHYIRQLASRLYDSSSFDRDRRNAGRPRSTRMVQAETDVLDMVEEDGTVNVRDISRRLRKSRSAVHRILQENLYHSYKFVRVQQLEPGDIAWRLEVQGDCSAKFHGIRHSSDRQRPQFICMERRESVGVSATRAQHHWSANI